MKDGTLKLGSNCSPQVSLRSYLAGVLVENIEAEGDSDAGSDKAQDPGSNVPQRHGSLSCENVRKAEYTNTTKKCCLRCSEKKYCHIIYCM